MKIVFAGLHYRKQLKHEVGPGEKRKGLQQYYPSPPHTHTLKHQLSWADGNPTVTNYAMMASHWSLSSVVDPDPHLI
jgi:hypothetical protein